MKNKFIVSFIGLILILLVLSGCVKSVEKGTAVTNDCIVYNLGSMPQNLNMTENQNIREKDLLCALFEGLVSEDEYGTIIPGAAESWNITEDGLRYTFFLKEDLKYSNGKKITSLDIVNFFYDFLRTQENNKFIELLSCLKGVNNLIDNDREITDDDLKNIGIKAEDEDTLIFLLNKKEDKFLRNLSNPIFTVRKLDYKSINYKQNFNSILYTGAFRIDEVNENKIILRKNKEYWNSENVKLEKLIFKSEKIKEFALVEFEKENVEEHIEVFANPPLSEIRRLNESDLLEISKAYNNVNVLVNNNEKNIDKQILDEIGKYICINNESEIIFADSIGSVDIQYVWNKSGIKGDGINGKNIDIDENLIKNTEKELVITYVDNNINKKIAFNISEILKTHLNINTIIKPYGEYDIDGWDLLISNSENEGYNIYSYPIIICRKKNIKEVYSTYSGNIKFDKSYKLSLNTPDN